MFKIALVMLGGCLGAVCRYGVGLLSVRLWGSRFPWGTLVVNLAGCLLIGLVFGLAEKKAWITPSLRLFLITGFLGALTTFSSFAWETVNAADSGSGVLAIINLMVNNAGGIALVLAGLWLGRVI